MQASVTPGRDPATQYLLRIGDTCLIHAQRLAEWTGHAPVLEEDIALSNLALDLIGQARAVLTLAGQRGAQAGAAALDEDQLAFLRDERDYRNPTLVELPNQPGNGNSRPGDFAVTQLRNAMVALWLRLLWQRLETSSDTELAAIAGKAVKEARYHWEHAAGWVLRLGDGTAQSQQRMQQALAHLWPYAAELFEADTADAAAQVADLGPSVAELQTPWRAEMDALLREATLGPAPAFGAFRSTGSRGVHSEHMGYVLAEMQQLQRQFPGARW
ncbi:MAG: 1,2-phenylacetyl-CoA epoxidase subunit PaaC [Aquabacterium sp.]